MGLLGRGAPGHHRGQCSETMGHRVRGHGGGVHEGRLRLLVLGTAHAQALGRARRVGLGQGMRGVMCCVRDRTCCVRSMAWDVVVCDVPAPSPSLMPTHTSNRIRAEGAAALSKSLEINSVLTVLNLGCM